MSVPLHSAKPYLLLTGATGMLGSQLLAKLLLRQMPVAVLARPKTGGLPNPPTSGSINCCSGLNEPTVATLNAPWCSPATSIKKAWGCVQRLMRGADSMWAECSIPLHRLAFFRPASRQTMNPIEPMWMGDQDWFDV